MGCPLGRDDGESLQAMPCRSVGPAAGRHSTATQEVERQAEQSLAPLDIDVGPEKKAANGYRHHATMFRMSWSKLSVSEKISKARP